LARGECKATNLQVRGDLRERGGQAQKARRFRAKTSEKIRREKIENFF